MPAFYYSLCLFGIMEFLGDVYPGLIDNSLCFGYLGCNAGFFGYDGVVHFMSGVCVGLGLVWFGYRRARDFALWTLGIAAAWELAEWANDAARVYFWHMDLLYPTNIMIQPSRMDTLGDMVLGCLGTAAVYALYRARRARHETLA